MSAVLDKTTIRALYSAVENGEMTWGKANQVHEMATPNVELYPWATGDSIEDWQRLTSFLISDSPQDERPPPDAQEMEDIRQRTLRVLRRLANRVIESGRPVTDMDAMVPESELTTVVPGLSNNPMSSVGFDWNAPPTASSLPVRSGGGKRRSQTKKFCKCIKDVRKTIRPRKGSTKESAAIAVCVKSVLHSRGRTVKRFKCGKPARLVTQKRR